jgi:hypothetical protein
MKYFMSVADVSVRLLNAPLPHGHFRRGFSGVKLASELPSLCGGESH